MKLKAQDIAAILCRPLEWGLAEAEVTGVSIDSRTVRSGDLFIALKGEYFDGDHFVEAAFAAGATVCLGSSARLQADRRQQTYIRVEDGLAALHTLALAQRTRLSGSMVAITGSNGKTTVKELAFSLLDQVVRATKNPGNQNGQIGVPLSLLQADIDQDVCVLEVGISAPSEMEKLVTLVQPDVAVLVNVGPVHLEFFDNEAHILAEKGLLLEALKADGLAIINGDDERITALAERLPCSVIRVGFGPDNDVTARRINFQSDRGTEFQLVSRSRAHQVSIRTKLRGRHNVMNILFAAAIADAFSLSDEHLVSGIVSFQNLAMRQELLLFENGLSVLNDSYNASPLSMKAAIDVLISLPGVGRHVAILGDMLELGTMSLKYHQEIGRYAHEQQVDLLITVGQGGAWISQEATSFGMAEKRIRHYSTRDDLAVDLENILLAGDTILIKASRRIGLEALVKTIRALSRFTLKETIKGKNE